MKYRYKNKSIYPRVKNLLFVYASLINVVERWLGIDFPNIVQTEVTGLHFHFRIFGDKFCIRNRMQFSSRSLAGIGN